MISKIKNHKATKLTARILYIKLHILLFLILPLVVFTLITSKTPLLVGIQSFVVLTGSMEPTISTGSLTYTLRQPIYMQNDIIAFKNASGQTVTHRIAQTINDGNITTYRTIGDANNSFDEGSVPQSDVQGKVIFTIPYLGKLMYSLKTPPGFILAIVIPSILFILFELWNIKKEIEKSAEKRILAKMNTRKI